MSALDTSEYDEHVPANPTGEGLALTHGAGGDLRSSLLIAIGDAFAQAGIYVIRFNLAYRKAKQGGPPSPSGAAKDRESIREAILALRKKAPGRIYLAGQSYGGRQASMLVAETPAVADALALFSYPLHPPGKPQQLRTEHFPNIRTQTIIIHGSRDPFASAEELEAARKLIPAHTEVYELPKAGHELLRGRFDIEPVITALRR